MTGSGGVSVRAGPSARPSGRRQAQRKAQRRYMQRQKRRTEGPEETELGGALVCGNCGQLGLASQGAGDPHRDQASALTRAPCSHCGECSWIDLGRPSNALALRTNEDDDARRTELVPGRAIARGLMGLALGMFVGLIGGGGWVFTLVVAGLAGLVAVLLTIRSAQAVRIESPQSLPMRWAMVLPPAAEDMQEVERIVSGSAEVRGELLRAPLSGRSCAAYEIGVRRDDDAEAPLATWNLLEQKIAELVVDGDRVDPARTRLELPRQRLGSLLEFQLDEPARVYLRQRGIGAEVVSVELFETIIEPGAEVSIAIGAQVSTLRAEG